MRVRDTKGKYGLSCQTPSKTIQSAKKECDINNILAKYSKSGLLSHMTSHQGQYGDFTGVTDYHTALDQVLAAQEMFASLPSSIRSKFSNDPGAFLDFATDPKNLPELVTMGLAKPSATPPVANPASSAPAV